MNKILIIEDEEVIRSAVRRLLERRGFATSEAGSVEDALSQHELLAFDLIIADVRLPGAPGTEVIAKAPGVRPPAMITFSPALVAWRAASSLLAMPPLLTPVALSRTSSKMGASRRLTVGITRDSGSAGSPSNSPSTSDSSTNSGARIKFVTYAASRSLSPKAV